MQQNNILATVPDKQAGSAFERLHRQPSIRARNRNARAVHWAAGMRPGATNAANSKKRASPPLLYRMRVHPERTALCTLHRFWVEQCTWQNYIVIVIFSLYGNEGHRSRTASRTPHMPLCRKVYVNCLRLSLFLACCNAVALHRTTTFTEATTASKSRQQKAITTINGNGNGIGNNCDNSDTNPPSEAV